MASKKAHQASGIAAGLLAAAIVIQANAGGPYYLLALLAALAGAWGGTAPDWMEVAWWRSKRHRGAGRLWITHRTVTHWGVAWVMLLIYGYVSLGSVWWAPVAFGFAAGGMMHLLTDNSFGTVCRVYRNGLLSYEDDPSETGIPTRKVCLPS